MPQVLYPPARPQSAREVLDTGLAIFKTTIASTLSYAMLLSLAAELANLRNIALGLPVQGLDATDPEWWAWNVAGLILSLLFWSALLLRQKALAAGGAGSAARELRSGLVSLSRLIIAVALATVAVVIALVPYGIGLSFAGISQVVTPRDMFIALALSPLTLPAAWLSVALVFAAPLVVLDRLGPLDALTASLRLVRGNWWRVSMVSGVIIMVLFTLLLLVALAAGVIVGIAGVSDLKLMELVAAPLGIIYSAFFVAVLSAVLLALLGDLKVRQDAPPGAPRPGP